MISVRGSIVIELGNGDVVVSRMAKDMKEEVDLVFMGFSDAVTDGEIGESVSEINEYNPSIYIAIRSKESFQVFLEAVEAMKPHADRLWG